MEIRKDEKEMFKDDDLAKSVWQSKYAAEGETHYDQMHLRMAKEFYRIDKKYQEQETSRENLSEYGKNRKDLTEEDIFNYFKDFKYIVPNGSVMAGVGTNAPVSYSNCVVIPNVLDSYGGIMYTDTQMVQLFKRRCGVGVDISNLRPNHTSVTNSAKTSTGAVSFMERYSNSVRETSQSGRRGALMLTMDIRHPDILEFINCKKDLTKVTGANISVKVTDDFMRAVEKDSDYILRFPVDSELTVSKYDEWYSDWDDGQLHYIPKDDCYVKVVKAKSVWGLLIQAAHQSAEPGILFFDNIINYSPDGVYEQYKPISTNPLILAA